MTSLKKTASKFTSSQAFVVPRLALLAGITVSLASVSPSKAVLLFDNMDGTASTGAPTLTATSSTPNTLMGDGYILSPNATDITGLDLFAANLSGTNFTSLKLIIYFWGTVNTGTVNSASPAFSNLLGSVSLTAPGTFTSGFSYSFQSAIPGVAPGIALGVPVSLPANDTTIGVTVNYQGSSNGVTYASDNSLTSMIAYGAGAAPTVGSDVFNGYYRNANSETNGNFTSTLRTLGVTNQSLGLRLYGDVSSVPEPTALPVVALTAALALARRRRRSGVT